MILDGMMVIIACITLTVMHPGVGFGNVWQEANFSFRTSKDKLRREGLDMNGSGNESSNFEAKGAGVRVVDA